MPCHPALLFARLARLALLVAAGALTSLVALSALSAHAAAPATPAVPASPTAPATPSTRPNILLIMADDMGFSDLGCTGSEIHTPNLDRLARDGMLFTQFYNNAKCTTTRATLLSGMYPRRNGNSIPRDIPTVAETLRAAGYATGMSGKWHLGSKAPQRPFDRGFDEYYGLMDGAVNYFNPARPDPAFKGGQVRVFGHNDQLVTSFPADFYTTDAFAAHAIETMKRFSAAGKPFFIHLAFNSPHYPLHAWPEDIAKYRGRYRAGWDALRRARYDRQNALGLFAHPWPLPPADEKSYDWAKSNQDWEDLRMATYAAMVDRMDQNIGRVLSALRDLHLDDHTVVLFLSDNGGCTEEPGGRDATQQPGLVSTYTAVGPAWGAAQNVPFRRYKNWTNEGGISTPLIVRWPGHIASGSRTDQIGHIIDLLPTFLEIAGASPLPELNGSKTLPLEGRSLAAVWRGETRPAPARLCWEWAGNCAIREGQWKAVWDTLNPAKQWQLYDLATDRSETQDLAPQHPETVRQLAATYATWAKSLDRHQAGQKLKATED